MVVTGRALGYLLGASDHKGVTATVSSSGFQEQLTDWVFSIDCTSSVREWGARWLNEVLQ